jgi:HEAT repeat protein
VRSLEAEDGKVLLQTIRLVKLLRLPPLVAPVGRLLNHDSKEIRHAVVDALAAIGSPSAMREMERAIDDKDRDVRVLAVKILGERGHRGAFPRVESAVKGRLPRGADLTEKMAFFEAYGLLAGSAGIATLKPMLQSKGVLRRKEDPETRACAAMALGKVRDSEALEVLRSAAPGEKDALVRNAINKALQESV